MRCTTCPLQLLCWSGNLDIEGQITLCISCTRLVIPYYDASIPHRLYYYTFQCEQRNLKKIQSHSKRSIKPSIFSPDELINDPGPGLQNLLRLIKLCAICTGFVNYIKERYIDLDEEELAIDIYNNSLGLSI